MQQSLEMARLAAELERRQELYAKRPKRKFISASTQGLRVRRLHARLGRRRWSASATSTFRRSAAPGPQRPADHDGVGGAQRRGQGRDHQPLERPQDPRRRRHARGAARQSLPAPAAHAEDIDILDITRTFDFKNGSVESE
jgi:protein TonB